MQRRHFMKLTGLLATLPAIKGIAATSEKNAPSGTWDPEIQTSTNNGAIIGYASKFIEESTQGDEMVEVIVPINYYQQTEQAPKNSYNIVISCSTSAYGDYMDACTSNEMYVDDFEWVY